VDEPLQCEAAAGLDNRVHVIVHDNEGIKRVALTIKEANRGSDNQALSILERLLVF
jgi:hypothetical protein